MDTEQQQPRVDDGFAQMVVDLVRSLDSDDVRYTDVIEGIVDAHHARMDGMRVLADNANRAVMAYAAMDRAQHDVLKYVRATVGQLAMANAAHMAHLDVVLRVRNQVHDLIIKAQEVGIESVHIDDLHAVTEGEAAPRPPQQNPVPVGLAVDSRFAVGHFTQGEQHITMPFLGWTMVVYSRFGDSRLEPTFLGHHGYPVTRTELAALDTRLVNLA